MALLALSRTRWSPGRQATIPVLKDGVIMDSISIRRQVSVICSFFKLMCGPRVPALQQLILPPLRPLAHPRTKRQHQSWQLSTAEPTSCALPKTQFGNLFLTARCLFDTTSRQVSFSRTLTAKVCIALKAICKYLVQSDWPPGLGLGH